MSKKNCRFEWLNRDKDRPLKGCSGWTRAALESHGVPWPPPRGWKNMLADKGVKSPKEIEAAKSAKESDLVVHFDGGCWPNPHGKATWGIVVKNKSGDTVASASGLVGNGFGMSNNVAEFHAAFEALQAIEEMAAPGWNVLLRGDSRIVINKLDGVRVSSGLCYAKCLAAKGKFRHLVAAGYNIRLAWVPRTCNTEADALTSSRN